MSDADAALRAIPLPEAGACEAGTDTARCEALEKAPDEAVDKAQIEVIYRQYAARVYNFMRYRAAGEQDAQDLTQAVFERVLAKFHRFDPAKGAFPVWLFALARNVLYDYSRARKKLPTDGGEALEALTDPALPPEERLLAAEQNQRLRAALASLANRPRTLLALKYGAGLRNTEIARVMGLSERNTAVILHRSLAKLRTALEKEDKDNA